MGIAEKQSLNSDNKLSSRVKDGVRSAGPSATKLVKEWNRAKEEDPTLEFKMTFVQWRNGYLKEYYKKRKKKLP